MPKYKCRVTTDYGTFKVHEVVTVEAPDEETAQDWAHDEAMFGGIELLLPDSLECEWVEDAWWSGDNGVVVLGEVT